MSGVGRRGGCGRGGGEGEEEVLVGGMFVWLVGWDIYVVDNIEQK